MKIKADNAHCEAKCLIATSTFYWLLSLSSSSLLCFMSLLLLAQFPMRLLTTLDCDGPSYTMQALFTRSLGYVLIPTTSFYDFDQSSLLRNPFPPPSLPLLRTYIYKMRLLGYSLWSPTLSGLLKTWAKLRWGANYPPSQFPEISFLLEYLLFIHHWA